MPNPSSVFVDQGSSQFVIVEVVDLQGNQLAADFQAQNVGAGITVEKDTTFLETTIGTHLETSARFIVTGVSSGSSSFDVIGAGATKTIPVRVTPTSISVTLSNAAPAANEPLTITLPAGFKFGAGAGANVAGDAGIVTSVAPDSSALTVVLPPGSTGPVTVDSVQVDFLPGVLFSLTAAEAVTVGAATPLPGTESPTTAPPLPIPPVGGTTAVFDVPDFVATIDHFYRLDITEPGDYIITVDWDVGSDVDVVLCFDAGCSVFDAQAATGNHPESGTFTLPAGTSYLLVEDFGADAAGAMVSITVQR